ncbi:MAG: J domain-containing protein [Alphaproteobacteria bacterium]|nr:J domain-containing protein [Alphaproteobacteria bacterium]
MRDPYSVLGVPATASDGEVKKAYHRLAKELHPDLNPDDSVVAERFKEVSAAYSLVGDAAQRRRFDSGEIDAGGQDKARYRYEYAGGPGGRGGQGGPGAGFGGGFNSEDIFGEFFSNMRGGDPRGRGGQARQQKGPDRSYKITVDFLDAAKGSTRRITLPDGRMLDVRIPAGIEDGKQIRLRGQGDPGPAGAGDALVEVSVRKHKQFRREGLDVHLDLALDLASAVLGGKIEVPTIDGAVTMKIPKGTNSGKTLRLKGKGILPPRADTAGNQYVHLQVTLPDPPDPELTALLESWAQDQAEKLEPSPEDPDIAATGSAATDSTKTDSE